MILSSFLASARILPLSAATFFQSAEPSGHHCHVFGLGQSHFGGCGFKPIRPGMYPGRNSFYRRLPLIMRHYREPQYATRGDPLFTDTDEQQILD